MTQHQPNGRIVAELRSGVLGTTLWANDADDGERLSVTLRRGYRRDPDSPWQETKMSLRPRDLLEAAEFLRRMYWMAKEHEAIEPNRSQDEAF